MLHRLFNPSDATRPQARLAAWAIRFSSRVTASAALRAATFFGVVLIVFLLSALRHDYQAQPPDTGTISPTRELFERAGHLRESIENHAPAQRTENDYLDLISVYERVLRLDDRKTAGDEALLLQAETYRQMGIQFKKPRYFYSAIQCYSEVPQRYPLSPNLTRALFGVARIFETDLQESAEAARVYAGIVDQFPRSLTAREARASLARLGYAVGERNPRDVIEARSQEDGGAVAILSQVRQFSGPDYARVILDLSAPIGYERKLAGPTLTIRLPNSKASSLLPARFAAANAAGMLKQIRVTPGNTFVEVSIDCSKIRDFAIFTLDSPPRIVADIRGARSISEDAELLAAAPPPSIQAAKETNDGSITLMRALGLKVKRIVIDPGHGGNDLGAIGKDNIYEKDVVLDIALRLRAAIKQQLKDVDVVMTRDTDRFIPLEERTAIANAQQADLFISIHANSSTSSLASGVETYFLSLEASKDELEVATRENATTSRSAGELQNLLQRLVLDTKVIESRDFAQHVQSGLVTGLGKLSPRSAFNRGVKKAPFVVLLGTNMPSVLAEVSFISHPKDAEALRTAEFRQAIADSLFSGIRNYVETLSKSPGATAVGGQ